MSDGVAKLQQGSDHTFTGVEMLSLAVTVFLLSFTFTIRLDLRKDGAGIVKDINKHVDRLDTGQESRDKPFDICYNPIFDSEKCRSALNISIPALFQCAIM